MRSLMFAGFLALNTVCLGAQDAGRTRLDSLSAGPASLIWSDHHFGGQELWFRRSFELSEIPKSASLVASCDDQLRIYVNGKLLAEESSWQKVVLIDVSQELNKDKNTIAVHATNNGGPAALVLWLIWEGEDGSAQELVSDEKWKLSNEFLEGWETNEFDESEWTSATASYERAFGNNVYAIKPQELITVGIFDEPTEELARALETVRAAGDVDAALEALDELEKALMKARRVLAEQKRREGK